MEIHTNEIKLACSDNNQSKCMLCEENQSKYSCPRCSIRYCSLNCYQHKTHTECSEKFYKEQVLNELKGMKETEENKEKIMNILKKMKDQDESAREIDDVTISERLYGIDLDDAEVVWEKLTAPERDLFQRYVTKGKLNFLPMWTPWWCLEKRSKVIDISQKKVKRSKKLPNIIKDLPAVKDIIGDKTPNFNLRFCVLDILLTYTCAQRIFNGDLYDNPRETVDIIMQLSKVLSENKVYSDLESCLYCFVSNLNIITDIDVDPVAVCLEDLRIVVTSNDSYVLRSLSDLYSYLKKYQKFLKKENEELSQQLFKMWKKVFFYTVYCGEYESQLKSLADGIREMQRHLLKDRQMVQKEKEIIEQNLEKLKPKPERSLIEEL